MFLNLSRDMFGVNPWDGTTYQVSSYGRRKRDYPGVVGQFLKKCVDLKPGESFTAADIEGPAVLTRIWFTVPRVVNPSVLRNLVFKVHWDGEPEPSVLTPIGDLFGTTFARPRDYSTAYLAITTGAYLCFLPMPFRRRAVITIENQSRLPVVSLFYQLTYLKLERDLPADVPYFHCSWHRENLDGGGPPYTVLDAEGKGFYLGCHLDMQGREYPWRLNPVRVVLPHGMGLGILEGWERMWIDGAEEPNVHGTGGEDYFNGAWYFTRVPSTHLTHGVTRRSYFARQVSCYRFHAEMPVCFKERIKVTLDHGLNNLLPATYEGTTYWYQDEPHRTLGDLPGPKERKPPGTMRNRLIMSSPLAFLAAAATVGTKVVRGR